MGTKKTNEQILNEKLIEIIKDRKIKQKDLATACGDSASNYSKWIKGEHFYKFKKLEEIAGVMRIDLKILIKEK